MHRVHPALSAIFVAEIDNILAEDCSSQMGGRVETVWLESDSLLSCQKRISPNSARPGSIGPTMIRHRRKFQPAKRRQG